MNRRQCFSSALGIRLRAARTQRWGGVREGLVGLAKVVAAAVVACIVVLLLLGPPRPYSAVECGCPEECRLVGEWVVEVAAQAVEAAFLAAAAVTAATAVAAALSFLRERGGEKEQVPQSRVVKSLPETM